MKCVHYIKFFNQSSATDGNTSHVIHECHNLLLMVDDQRWKEMLQMRVASSIKEKGNYFRLKMQNKRTYKMEVSVTKLEEIDRSEKFSPLI